MSGTLSDCKAASDSHFFNRGSNTYGELGVGDDKMRLNATLVPGLVGYNGNLSMTFISLMVFMILSSFVGFDGVSARTGNDWRVSRRFEGRLWCVLWGQCIVHWGKM